MRTAGYEFEAPLFTTGALATIAQYSEGIPRNINNLCFNSLSLGCALKQKTIDSNIVREVVTDLDLDRWRKKSSLVARPDERGSQEAPAFLSASAPSMLTGWIPKLAIAIVVLLILVGVLFSRRWTASKAAVQTHSASPAPAPAAPSTSSADRGSESTAAAEDAVQADSVVAPVVAAAPSSSSADQGPPPVAPGNEILVTPNRTLLGICVQNFGKCNPELLQEIHRLNPRLSNFDHIETGQRIRMPVSGALQSSTEQPGKNSLAEGKTNE
jgi:hypothetical protein